MVKKIFKPGDAVISIAGHDAARKYVVTKVLSENFVECADGNFRPLNKPKIKRNKHLELLRSAVAQGGSAQRQLNDCEIKKTLKELV